MQDTMTIDYQWDLSSEAELEAALSAAAQLDASELATEVAMTTDKKEDFALELNHFDPKEQEDKLWQARTGLNFDTLCGAIETIIFMSDRPIAIQKIKAQIDEELPLRVLHEALSLLQKGYEARHHGIRLVEVAEGFQFRTKATYAKFVQNLFKINSLVLTPTALEVLAIIAYKQPVSKTEVERIRGVDSSHIIRALMDKRLVKINGRSEEIGRPSLYGTTEEFLEVFNLADVSQLPPEHELSELASQNTVGNIADIKTVVTMGDKKKFDVDELEELDKLSESIKDIASDTDFTMLLKSEEKRRIDGVETGLKRSAFDILEDFVLREETVRANMTAANSELLMSAIEPKIADVESTELLNAPVIDEEWEAMNQELALDEESTEEYLELTLSEEETTEMNEDHVTQAEALELEAALEDAFERLTGNKLAEEEMSDSEVAEQLQSLDFTLDEAIMKGKDLDLDLSFLTEYAPEDTQGNTPSES